MKHAEGMPKKLWVYNENTGTVTKRTVVFGISSVESWYATPKGWPTYDPIYVDENKEVLINRVSQGLCLEVQDHLKEVERTLNRIGKLTSNTKAK